VITELSS